MREAERQKEEAIEFAKKRKNEANNLKNVTITLDTKYTEELEKKVHKCLLMQK